MSEQATNQDMTELVVVTVIDENFVPAPVPSAEEIAILAKANIRRLLKISPRQARAALLQRQAPAESTFSNCLEFIENTINSLEEPSKTMAKITWEYATQVERLDPLVEYMREALGMSDLEMDEMFEQAAMI